MFSHKIKVLLGIIICVASRVDYYVYAQDHHYTLEECVALGVRNNDDLRIQINRVNEAKYKYYQQMASFLPQIDGTIVYKKYDKLPLTQKELAGVQKIGERPAFEDYIAGVVLSQIVFSGSKYYQMKALQTVYEYELLRYDLARLKINLAVAKAFYEQLRSNYALTIQKELTKKLLEQKVITELLYRGGKLTNIDLLKVQTQLAVSEDTLENLKNLSYSKALVLGQVLGMDEPVYAKHELAIPPDNYFDMTQCSSLSKNHPELKVAQLLQKKADFEKDQSYSATMPTVYFNANYYREESKFFPGYPNWYIGFFATMPLFHGGSIYSEIKQAHARYEQITQSFHKTAIELGVRYQVSLATLKDRKNRIVTTQKALDLANEALIASELKYRTGKLTTIELLDAHVVWNNSYMSFINGLIDYYIACEEMRYLCAGTIKDKEQER